MNKIFKYDAITQYQHTSDSGFSGGSLHSLMSLPENSFESSTEPSFLTAKSPVLNGKSIFSVCPLHTTYYFNDSLRLAEKDVVISDILEVMQDNIVDKTRHYRISGRWRRDPAEN